MSDFIKEIPSDSKIQKVELLSGSARITFLMGVYESKLGMKSLILDEVCAYNMLPGWQNDIESVSVSKEGELLERTRLLLQEDGEPSLFLDTLKCYQIISSSSGRVVIEMIARAHHIE